MMPVQVKIAESPAEIGRCFPAMKQLREKLTPEVFEGLVAALGARTRCVRGYVGAVVREHERGRWRLH